MKKAITILACLVLYIVGYARTISISSETELREIASAVNNGNNTYDGDTIILTRDIVLTGEWTPIGKNGGSTHSFKGVFDGRNHTISNLCIRNYSQDRVGLFGCIDNATVRNIIVHCYISTSKTRVGGICGLMESNSKIENCHFIGQIVARGSGDVYAGGIVGEILKGGAVDRCSATGLVYGETDKAKCVGGIVGRSGPESNGIDVSYKRTTITNCINLADVYGLSSVGGIIAYIRHNVTVENCLNCGNINGFTPPDGNKYYGGIVGGYYFGMRVYNCLSTGTVSNNKPSAVIGVVTQGNFPDTCPKVNVYYDYQRMYLNYSRHGVGKYTSEIINGSISSALDGWAFDGGYPYPKGFTYDSVIMVAKSYALFSNSETYDDIHTNFNVSNFEGTAWGSTGRGLTEIDGSDVNILADGRDTLTVRCGSYYKNVIVDVNVPTPLPITLLYFTVTETDCGNLLEWATATERHNAGFSLMRSPDATDWEAFAWKPTLCGGNSTTTTNYSHMDADIRWDTTYYRFIQYDSIWSQSETYYPEASEIIVAMRQGRRAELPNIMYDGGCILLVAGSATTDAYAYDTTGRLIYDTRLKPHATARLVVRGNAIVEFLWVENGELMRKAYKVGCWY